MRLSILPMKKVRKFSRKKIPFFAFECAFFQISVVDK